MIAELFMKQNIEFKFVPFSSPKSLISTPIYSDMLLCEKL